MSIHEQYARAVREAARTKPYDCTCDGLHTTTVGPEIDLPALIDLERRVGGCPAETRALVRILASR